MGSKKSNKDYYGLWKGLFNKSWIGSEHDEWFEITPVSHYLDDILYSFVRSTSPDKNFWIRIVTSRKSMTNVMLDQEYNQSWMIDF